MRKLLLIFGLVALTRIVRLTRGHAACVAGATAALAGNPIASPGWAEIDCVDGRRWNDLALLDGSRLRDDWNLWEWELVRTP